MNLEQLAANAGMTLSNAGYSMNIACSTEALQRFADMVSADERVRVRAALIDEAKIWVGDHRTAAWTALCDGANRAGIAITKDDCHLAMRAWLQQVEAESSADADSDQIPPTEPASPKAEPGEDTMFVSFRAECAADVDRLISHLVADHPGSWGITQNRAHEDVQFADRSIELMIRPPLTVDGLRTCMSKVVDGHVMSETLRAVRLQENSLERRDEVQGRVADVERP